MRAVIFEAFAGPLSLRQVPEPDCPPDGAVVAVEATGLCRSDWHGWLGHDPDVRLPHVPGHEFAGRIAALGSQVRGWQVGELVTTPFVNGCGRCVHCLAGDHQVCPEQTQPGFSRWGSFAELVVVERAEVNLVAVPAALDAVAAASLGCRFATAYRAVTEVGRVGVGQWLVVAGCGGVGLSAVMIAVAAGARVVALDIRPEGVAAATALGAEHAMVISPDEDPLVVGERVRELTGGGAHVSLDAVGTVSGAAGHGRAVALATCLAASRPRGRHVQVGLTPAVLGWPEVPIHLVIGRELEVLGSHGLSPRSYPQLLSLAASGAVRPAELVGERIGLEGAGAALAALGDGERPGADRPAAGITVIIP